MVRLIEKLDSQAICGHAWLSEAISSFDAVATLAATLGFAWTVEREVDPAGEMSIVVTPARDDPAGPTFLLYEQDGLAQVATLIGETWRDKQAFPTCRRAVDAIIAVACPAAAA